MYIDQWHLGSRPLPTFLGGGDLDGECPVISERERSSRTLQGDVYCVTNLEQLLPPRCYEPAAYAPTERKVLNRRSTMQDVADFVTEYLSNDVRMSCTHFF